MKKLLERFTRKNWKKANRKNLTVEQLIKRKDDKLYVKWKSYDSFFNKWIDKKYIVSLSEYFLEPKYSGVRVKSELDFSDFG